MLAEALTGRDRENAGTYTTCVKSGLYISIKQVLKHGAVKGVGVKDGCYIKK